MYLIEHIQDYDMRSLEPRALTTKSLKANPSIGVASQVIISWQPVEGSDTAGAAPIRLMSARIRPTRTTRRVGVFSVVPKFWIMK